ncbi:hypothetical protein STEG23_010883, partial [Scotinomys teguina]
MSAFLSEGEPDSQSTRTLIEFKRHHEGEAHTSTTCCVSDDPEGLAGEVGVECKLEATQPDQENQG